MDPSGGQPPREDTVSLQHPPGHGVAPQSFSHDRAGDFSKETE